MSGIPASCRSPHNNPTIVLREKGQSVRFINTSRLEVEEIRVDGCAITEGLRCDYLLQVPSLQRSYLIELKGSDVEHAVKQLTTSHRQLRPCLLAHRVWIVSARTVPMTSSQVQIQKDRVRREFQAELKVQSGGMQIALEGA